MKLKEKSMKKIIVNGVNFLKSQNLNNITFKKCNIINNNNTVEINFNETYFQPTKEDTFRPEGNIWEISGIALSGNHYAINTKFDLNNIYIKVNDSLIWAIRRIKNESIFINNRLGNSLTNNLDNYYNSILYFYR